MEDYESTYRTIFKEITQNNAEVHNCFLQEFSVEITEFSRHMTRALLNWRNLESEIMKEHEQGLNKS